MPNETREAITASVTEIATRVAAPEGIEIVETQLLGSGSQRVLRIFIDKPAGVTHSDCEYMSLQVGTVLDMEDVIPGGRYTLEVSSPGLERPLKSAADFTRFAGQKAKIVLRQPVEGKTVWTGIIGGCSEGRITVDEGTGKTATLPLDQVRKANLKFDW